MANTMKTAAAHRARALRLERKAARARKGAAAAQAAFQALVERESAKAAGARERELRGLGAER
jgi:hypothetical protein